MLLSPCMPLITCMASTAGTTIACARLRRRPRADERGRESPAEADRILAPRREPDGVRRGAATCRRRCRAAEASAAPLPAIRRGSRRAAPGQRSPPPRAAASAAAAASHVRPTTRRTSAGRALTGEPVRRVDDDALRGPRHRVERPLEQRAAARGEHRRRDRHRRVLASRRGPSRPREGGACRGQHAGGFDQAHAVLRAARTDLPTVAPARPAREIDLDHRGAIAPGPVALSAGVVAQKTATTGTRRAHATCIGALSFAISTSSRSIDGDQRREVGPAREHRRSPAGSGDDRLRERALRRVPPSTTHRAPLATSAAATAAKPSGVQRLVAQTDPGASPTSGPAPRGSSVGRRGGRRRHGQVQFAAGAPARRTARAARDCARRRAGAGRAWTRSW